MSCDVKVQRPSYAKVYVLPDSPAMWPLEYVTMSGLRQVFAPEESKVSDVFKARVLLDVLGILGDDNETAYATLRQRAATAQYHFGIRWELDREIAEGLVLPDNLAAELCKKNVGAVPLRKMHLTSLGVSTLPPKTTHAFREGRLLRIPSNFQIGACGIKSMNRWCPSLAQIWRK